MADLRIIQLGPQGSRRQFMKEVDHKGRTEIARILVSHDESTVTSLQFQYFEHKTLVESETCGVIKGSKFDIVTLDYPTEYITGISGTSNTAGVKTLSIRTNKGFYDQFGGSAPSDSEVPFRYNFGPDMHFYGFYGVYHTHGLYSIGVYVNPMVPLNLVKTETQLVKTETE